MNLQKAVEVLKLLRESIKQGGELPTIFKEHTKAIDTVIDELGNRDKSSQVAYTAKDMEEFAEWCVYHCIRYNGGWIFKYAEISSLNIKTTAQLRELWEVETGRKEEADISVKQKCPECGDESYNSDGNYCLNSDCRLFFI